MYVSEGAVSPTNVFLVNDTLAANKAQQGKGGSGGGGVTNKDNGPAGNGGNSQGGGLYAPKVYQNPNNPNNNITLANTLIAENTAPLYPDVWAATVTSSDHNLIGDGSGFSAAASNGDQIGTTANPINPSLGPLQNNGGPTLTMALPLGSPAIDAGDNNAAPSATDKRGYARIVGKAIDIGAYEYFANALTSRHGH